MSGNFVDADNLDARSQNQELANSPELELSEFELLDCHRELCAGGFSGSCSSGRSS